MNVSSEIGVEAKVGLGLGRGCKPAAMWTEPARQWHVLQGRRSPVFRPA